MLPIAAFHHAIFAEEIIAMHWLLFIVVVGGIGYLGWRSYQTEERTRKERK